MENTAFPIDLHCHSTLSDGGDTYAELCAVAKKRGVRLFVVADHDVMPDLNPEGEPLFEFSRARGTAMLPAIEFSCDTLVPDVHIVGLGCDFTRDSFHQFELDMARSKVEGYRKLVRLLAEDGMKISWDSVLHPAGGAEINEMSLQGKHIFNAIAACGGAEDWSAAKKMIQTTPRYAAVKRQKIDPKEAIAMVLDAGGFPILAHPHLINRNPRSMLRHDYINNLVDAGLMGIEGPYPYNKTSYRGVLTNEEIEARIREQYGDRLFISGGSDYHNDAKSGSKNPRLMGEKGVYAEDILACEPLKNLINRLAPGVLDEIAAECPKA